MINKLLKVSILILLFFYGCSELLNFEPVIPSWESVFSFKLTSEKIILGEAIESGEIDTVICSDSELCDSLRGKIFLFTQTKIIEPTAVGDSLSMDDIHKSFTQNVGDVNIEPVVTNLGTSIGIIDLGAMDPQNSPNFGFRDIIPDSLEGILQIAIGGNPIPIDSVSIESVSNEFSFPNFESATINWAGIKLEIINDMFIHLGNPINISLINPSNDNIIGNSVEFDTAIPPNSSDSAFITLQPGTILPGNINVEVSGSTIGTDSVPVSITEEDMESSFYVIVTVQSMSVISATALIPSQEISNTSEMPLGQGGDENEKVIISSAVIKEGFMSIEIDNGIELSDSLVIKVDNLVSEDGDTLIVKKFVESLDTLSMPTEINLSNYVLTMENDIYHPNYQKIFYSYDVITMATEPEMATVDSSNFVDVKLILSGETDDSGITFSTITGIFQKSISTSDEISMDSGTKLYTAEIDSGSIIIDIENNLNLEASVVFSLKEFLNGTEDTLVQEFELTAGENTNSIIDLSGYTIKFDEDSVQSEAGQVIHYTSDVTMGEEEMTLNLEDSLVINVDIKDLSFKSISGILDTISVPPVSMSIPLPEYPIETTQLVGLGLAKTTITIEMISDITIPVEIDLKLKGVNSETMEEEEEQFIIPLKDTSMPSSGGNYELYEIIDDTTRMVFDNLQALINIFPDTIFADVHAVIGGGDNIGQVTQTDSIQGMVYVEVPLAFEVQDSVILELDPDSLGIVFSDTTYSNNILEVIVEALIKNSLELSIELTTLVDQDTLFENPDTLIDGFNITGGFTDTNQIKLDEYFIDLFTEETYMKNIVTILGQSDTSGNVLPSVLYTTDSLSIDIRGTLKILIDSTLINSEEE